jgi:hypothetical protein
MSRSAVSNDPTKNMHAVEGLMEDILGAYIIRLTFIMKGWTVSEGYKELDGDDTDVKDLATRVVERLTCLTGGTSEDPVLRHTQVRK